MNLTAEPIDPRPQRNLNAFAETEAWIFDLDNTLYPRSSNLFRQVDERIRLFVRDLLGIDEAEAEIIQKTFYKAHGTTLRGLMLHHQVNPDEFLEFVHNIDHSVVQPDPALGQALKRLPGKKYIFTNGSRRHAEKVAERLGFTDHFEDIFDIVAANLVPKPERETYDRFVSRFGVIPERAAMFEDLTRNLLVPKAVGMTTVLVVPPGTREMFHGEWEFEGRDDDHIDFVTGDIAHFVADIADALSGEASA
jgi:putative hydrolase of the HAD superfamily